MTLELSQETQALLERALASGQFSSADHVIQYALGKAVVEGEIPETEIFVTRVEIALAASKEAVAEGKVVEVPKGTLADLMVERHKERLKSKH
jgi:Arc/MetJ-type ribon-helix-helix transcriptional regulator